MRDDKLYIINLYQKVKALGFVRSNRSHNTGIGKTFEDYMGVVENNLKAPDLAGYEIKSHREESSSYTTLFTKAPDFPPSANALLNERFGTPYEEGSSLKKLHTSIFATSYNSYMSTYSFRLINDKQSKQIRIGVYEFGTYKLLDHSTGYSYSTIDRILSRKLKKMFYVSAERKFEQGEELFFFNHADIYLQPSLSKFLELLDAGLIMYDIRMGCYQSGRKYGLPHDHGSCFRMLEQNIHLLYEVHETID